MHRGRPDASKSWMRGDSIQVAYTIGGVGLKYAQSKYDNIAYGFGTAQLHKRQELLQYH